MKLKELKARVDFFMQREANGELEVCIPNNKSGMYGGTPVTGVAGASQGIDWDHSKFIIWPQNEMIEKPKKP